MKLEKQSANWWSRPGAGSTCQQSEGAFIDVYKIRAEHPMIDMQAINTSDAAVHSRVTLITVCIRTLITGNNHADHRR